MPSIKHTDVNLGLGQYRMVGTDYKIIGKKIGKSLILYVSKCTCYEKDKLVIKEVGTIEMGVLWEWKTYSTGSL